MTVITAFLLGAALVLFVGVLIPVTDNRSKLWLLAYGVVVATTVTAINQYYLFSAREGQMAIEARQVLLLKKEASTETFIQAALTFLDKNKDLYPDTYLRAREVCVHHQCHTSGDADPEEARATSYDLTQAGTEMDAILRKLTQAQTAQP